MFQETDSYPFPHHWYWLNMVAHKAKTKRNLKDGKIGWIIGVGGIVDWRTRGTRRGIEDKYDQKVKKKIHL